MITLNTSIQNYGYSNRYRSNTTFRGATVPPHSAFLNPLKKGFNKLTDCIGKYYTGPLQSCGITNWLFHRNDIGRIVDHMQAIGSYVISGMYMTQTLRNKDMDEDRKITLAINQGLTLVASTAIAYFISEKLVGPWNKHVSMKYAAKKLNTTTEKLAQQLKDHQNKIKKLYIEKHPEDLELKKFKKPNLIHYVENALKDDNLVGKLKGLDVLKSLIIFGSVYRFFGPVAVTPIANWLGDKITGTGKKSIHKKEQEMKKHIDQAKENTYSDFDKTMQTAAKIKFLKNN